MVAETVSDIDLIRSWRLASGFRHVYRHGLRWRAEAWGPSPAMGERGPKVILGSFVDPVRAAEAVVAWFKATYGEPAWRKVVARRPVNKSRVRRRGDGFTAEIYIRGTAYRLPAPGDTHLFGSREDAKHAVRVASAVHRPSDLWRG